MNKIHLMAALALAVLGTSGAQAQSRTSADIGYYGEIGYSPVEISGAGGDGKAKAMRFLIGNEINKNLGVEAVYTTTTSKDSRVGYDATISSFGLLLKPKMALSESTQVFARAGIMRSEITASTSGSHTGTDFAYGLGIQTNFTKSVYGQLDYMRTYDRDSISAKGYTLSLGTRF
jgi:opacity protein-like surface antigen